MVFRIKPFLPNRAQRPDKNSPTWNFMANLMMHITCLCLAVLKSFIWKTSNKSKNHEYSRISERISKKFQHFFTLLDVCFHVNWSKINYLSTEKNFKKSSEFSLCINEWLRIWASDALFRPEMYQKHPYEVFIDPADWMLELSSRAYFRLHKIGKVERYGDLQ